MNLFDMIKLKSDLLYFTFLLLLVIVLILTLLVAIICIAKLRKTNKRHLNTIKQQYISIEQLNRNSNYYQLIKSDNKNLNHKVIALNKTINELKEKNHYLSNINISNKNEIARLKEEIASFKNKENEVTIKSNTLSVEKEQTNNANGSARKAFNSDENILCNNLYLFTSKRRCWKCNQITQVVCLGTDDAYTLFDDKTEYERYRHLQLLSYVTKVPKELSDFLKKEFKYYPSLSKHINQKYYINHCEHCNSIQGDNYIHEVPEEAIYKHLCYKNSEKADYYVFKNDAVIPLQASLPYYDRATDSFYLMFDHIFTKKENRASLNITQKLIDNLISDSNYCGDLEIEYL